MRATPQVREWEWEEGEARGEKLILSKRIEKKKTRKDIKEKLGQEVLPTQCVGRGSFSKVRGSLTNLLSK